MCISPVTIYTPDGAQLISCRECWQCRQRKIDDLIGRNIAESKTAVASHAFTLTYGTDEHGSADHIRARILTYSDVQKLFKKLRFDGYPCRYFVAGEYGENKGRAHWHGVIYWLDKVPPDIKLRKERTMGLPHWEHGWSFIDHPSVQAVRYACKYIQKDMHKGGKQGMVHYSRMPPLGTAYFKILAESYVAAGKAPQDLFYTFPEIKRQDRKTGRHERIKFSLQGRSKEIFFEHFLEKWREKYGAKHVPTSEPVDDYLDSLVTEDMLDAARGTGNLHPDPRYGVPPVPVPKDLRPWMVEGGLSFDNETKHWVYDDPHVDMQRLYYCHVQMGAPAWKTTPGSHKSEAYYGEEG